ncbi:UNVERIFIED_CONTAM: hypothetical protein Sangu_3243500 [Sesamum angustifolium]|uniref:Uncharacterized protein n=1 Tax=Sesamum angustifolium TaxID=2727405 RepID=A0AAW2JHZ1_9LAMI
MWPATTGLCAVRDWILESRAYYGSKEKTETEPSPLHAVQKRPAQGQGEDGAALPGDDPGEERTITILRRGKRYYISLS